METSFPTLESPENINCYPSKLISNPEHNPRNQFGPSSLVYPPQNKTSPPPRIPTSTPPSSRNAPIHRITFIPLIVAFLASARVRVSSSQYPVILTTLGVSVYATLVLTIARISASLMRTFIPTPLITRTLR